MDAPTHNPAANTVGPPEDSAAVQAPDSGLPETQHPPARDSLFTPADERPEKVGRYFILETLGEGGMGTVFKAEQRQPIKRLVALKLIKGGHGSREVINRFESERQALARMDHPNVAKVLDAGTSEQGQPFFVMEYVDGEPLPAWADEKALTIRQRLEVFIQVCQAISHAHGKALLHRDIKGNNVLGYWADGRPTAKVIDFGIAKAVGEERLVDATLTSGSGAMIGTPYAMSPEQADGSADIDTRTDVYALGVLLYELLCGRKPFDPKELKNKTLSEMLDVIRSTEPLRPSVRLQRLGVDAEAMATDRSVRLPVLIRDLARELEWIPLKAMRKERERRYASAAELAEDCRNYLEGRPLLAGPESRVYRLKKFVGRNKVGVVAGAVLVLAGLAVSVAGAKMLKARANEADARANEAKAQADAAIYKSGADGVVDFAEGVFFQGSPLTTGTGKSSATVLDALSEAVKYLDKGKLDNSPENKARLLWRIGQTFNETGKFDAARHALEEATAIYDRILPPTDPRLPDVHNDLATVLAEIARRDDLSAAEAAEREFKAVVRFYVNAKAQQSFEYANAQSNLGSFLLDRNRVPEAQAALAEAQRILEGPVGAAAPGMVATLLDNIGGMAENVLKDKTKALQCYERSLQIRLESLGPGETLTATSLNNIANVWVKSNDASMLPKAVDYLRRACKIYTDKTGATDSRTLQCETLLAKALRSSNKREEALAVYEELIPVLRSQGVDLLPALATANSGYGQTLEELERYNEAYEPLREAFDWRVVHLWNAPSYDQQRIKLTGEPLARVCDHLKRPDEAKQIRAKLAELAAASATRP